MTRGLDYTTVTIPFVAGLNTRGEWRANQPPALDVALNVQFDDIGGLQLRKPYTAIDEGIFGDGTIADCRKLVAFDNELLLFTKDTLYSYSSQQGAWVNIATHLAVATDETTRFAGRSDQVQCDRAELNNTIVYAWTETVDHVYSPTTEVSYAAAIDKSTGAILMAPSQIGQKTRCRVTALSTKILLTYIDTGNALQVRSLDPADPATGFGAGNTVLQAAASMNASGYYDVCKLPGADTALVVCQRAVTTSYEIKKVTAALGITTATIAKTCDGPIAVTSTPTGSSYFVVRGNGTGIEADRIDTALATVGSAVAIGTATGTPVNQIAAACRSTQNSGQYRCYAFWSAEQSISAVDQRTNGFYTGTNWVDDGSTAGTPGVLVAGLGVASRAFDHGGRIFVHLAHAGTTLIEGAFIDLQNTYYLYRDDGELVGKSAQTVGGGYPHADGHLPNVVNTATNIYAWCATERRKISVIDASSNGFAARAPRDVVIEFDTNRARRCARLGRTLYVTGSEIKQYDGADLTEVGFHTFLWWMTLAAGTGGSGLATGDYSYTGTYRCDNAKGERERSAPVDIVGVNVPAGPDEVQITNVPPLRPTHKTGIVAELWRTKVDPADGAPFYLVTSQDPAVTTTPNQYLPNPDPDDASFVVGGTSFNDVYTDATAGVQESITPGGELESIVPPGASIIAANDTRIFLAGLAADPDRVWYSRHRADGEVASFNDYLSFDVPHAGGDITALAFLNETLYVFRETAIYMVPGDGFANDTTGQNYGPAICISADIGAVSAEAVALTPLGLLFKSSKGWYVLGGAQGVQYVGAGVADYDSESPVAITVVESQHQIRCLTASRMLVLDYLAQQWAEWSIGGGLDAVMWQGSHTYISSTASSVAPYVQGTTYSGVDYAMDVELAWWKPSDLLGENKLQHFHILGEYRGDHDLRVRIAKDYEITNTGDPGSPTWHTDEYHSIRTAANGNVAGQPINLRAFSARPNFMALKIRITAVGASDHGNPPSGAACRLTGIALRYAPRNLSGARVPPPPSAPASS